MLAIRLQRLGRRGYAVYRVIIQEAQRHPQSGQIVAYAGNYNPHTKEADLDEALIQKFLDNGAQPSDRVVKLLREKTKVKLPKWVAKTRLKQSKAIKNPSKLRRNAPKGADKKMVAESETSSTKDEKVKKDVPAESAPVENKAKEVEKTKKDEKDTPAEK